MYVDCLESAHPCISAGHHLHDGCAFSLESACADFTPVSGEQSPSTPHTGAKHPKEQATSTVQSAYRATPRDFAALTRSIESGDTLYTQTGDSIQKWTVTEHRSAISTAPMVTPDGGTALIAIQQLLARCGAIYTQLPTQP